MTAVSTAPPITATGMKGFLLWFKREQPAIYNQVAPKIPRVAPKAFSNYTARRKRLGAIYRSRFSQAHRVGVAGFGDYYSLPTVYVSAPSTAAPISVDYTAQLMAPSYVSSPTVDYSTQLTANPVTTGVDTGALQTVSPVANAANTGVISTPTVGVIGALIGVASAVALTNNQAALQQSAVQTNLQRAAAGLPPLNTSLNALGVPTITASTDTGTRLLIGCAALVLVLMMGAKSS